MRPTLRLLPLLAFLLLQFHHHANADCKPAACGDLTLRYPFWLGSINESTSPCGHPDFEVWCIGDGGGSSVASLKGSTLHVHAINYTNNSFVASHIRVAGGDDGVCRTDLNMSLQRHGAEGPRVRQRYLQGSNCGAPIYAYLGGAYYWDKQPAIATGGCKYSYVPVLGSEAADMTAANYSRLLKDGFVLEREAAGVGDCAACEASGGQCRFDNAGAGAFWCLCPDGRRVGSTRAGGESLAPTSGLLLQ
ncbi:unnamed protein product [Urochloa decumbens]|uniref:Wall-associated receptor kinase galacturonan-binding domain-containing protein n=1 Tax=Urochloa decumbens TaxID=240449 RepID=A0ABC8YW71_9POAL